MIEIDRDRQKLARSLAGERLRARLISTLISVSGIIVLWPLGLASGLKQFALQLSGIWPVQVAIFFGVIGLLGATVEAPLTYYSSFVLPHRYGLSTQTMGQWLSDMLKGIGIAVVLGGVAVEVLYACLRLSPDWWWIWVALAYIAFAVLLSSLAPVLLLPLFFRLAPLRDERLASEILALAVRANTRVKGVCEINLSSKTRAANAAVIGLGATRKIVLGDTLIDEFKPDEVSVVVAHELGHHVHRDIGKGLVLETCLSVAGFGLTALVLQAMVNEGQFEAVWDLAAFPVLAVCLGVWGLFSGVVSRAFSRWMESNADLYSLQLTGSGEAFVASEIRLTNQNLGWLDPPAWLELILYTHPAPWRRIAMGERYLADNQRAGDRTIV